MTQSVPHAAPPYPQATTHPVVVDCVTPVKFDRTVSFGLLLALGVQTAGAMFWAGAVDTRLKGVEQAIAQTPQINERLAGLESQSNANRELLLRIEARINSGGPR